MEATQRRSIALSGRATFRSPEIWETVGDTGLWVRNVSQPALIPFLPDASIATGAAIIIAPGGAFFKLAMSHEGFAVANWLTRLGIAAFVLKYRLAASPDDPGAAAVELAKHETRVAELARAGGRTLSDLLSREQWDAMLAACEDASEAIRCIRLNAAELGISPDRVGLIGFSAGAGIAVGAALNADISSRPNMLASMYGALPSAIAVPPTAPPAFIAAAADDEFDSFSVDIYKAWREGGARAELHVFENGGHGFGIVPLGKRSDLWPNLFDQCLQAWGFKLQWPSRATE
jgi:acetyl esterase/lipase